jgi:hypothetical protein
MNLTRFLRSVLFDVRPGNHFLGPPPSGEGLVSRPTRLTMYRGSDLIAGLPDTRCGSFGLLDN